MATLDFPSARDTVVRTVSSLRHSIPTETVPLADAAGRVLACDVPADRDYPPVTRSIRDGFAVRAADLPGTLRLIGEIRAGESFPGVVAAGEAVEIMTGAPLPAGADCVVMVEHVVRHAATIRTDRKPQPGDFVNPRGAEFSAGAVALPAGTRTGFAEIALLATVGCSQVSVFRKPSVAILATGDEIVPVEQAPLDHQIRNSNAHSLAVQVARAGGEPLVLPVARDSLQATRELVRRGLECDLLLLSGGVSAGKYDLVEPALAECGADFYFDRVLIQPGQPVVFGRAADRFFFGLPGNPLSTMVTFELFARAAVELLAGQSESILPLLWSRLAAPFRHQTGLTRFLPALLSADGGQLTPVAWKGSSDLGAISRANAFLVAESDRESWEAGDWMRVLLK